MTTPDSAVCVFIDGIIESKFITGTNIVPAKDTVIQVNSGRWKFNHFGVAFFNFYSTSKGSSSSSEGNFSRYSAVYKKYLYDIDPIIPVNYWQTWKKSMKSKDSTDTTSEYTIDASIYNKFSTYNGQNAWLNYLTTASGANTV